VSWKRVRGHEAQVRAFAQAVRRNRLAHAYLFTGPPGVGKRLFAQELAKALLCETAAPDRLEACDRCPSCLQVEAGTQPDCLTASLPEGAHEFPIDDMRELCRRIALKPMGGRGKVVILDDADDLNGPSANCFLKTLEEPPPRSVLILVGSSPERQLPTIVSRCQVVRFAPLPEALVADLLRQQELPDAHMIDRLARLSGGSPGQALALADPELWAFRRTLIDGLTRPQPDGVALGEALMHFVEEAGKDSAAQRRRAALVLRLLVEFLNDVLRVRVGGAPRLGEAEDRQTLEALAGRLEPERLLEVLERCLEGDVQIDRRVQLVLVLEALLDALGQRLKC
jgi:DNA polymerase-3 subunit delta'